MCVFHEVLIYFEFRFRDGDGEAELEGIRGFGGRRGDMRDWECCFGND
jgi:hypothetical protein